MMLRRLNDDLPEAVANARNEFGMLGRQMEEMREKFEFSFGAEQLRDWEEASKKLSASMMADQDAVTENLKENVDYRNQLMSGFASTISGMINAISGYWNAYYSNLLQNEKLTDEERKKIQYEQAKKAKNLALFNAIITGTEAIINGFATKPFFPLGIAMGALATALTAVQIGAIAAQPLPKLAKGGKLIRPTLFLGGEAGAEYVVPELKLDELGQRITSAMRDTRITNTFTDDRPIQLSINLDGRQLDAHIQRSISNRRILVEEGSVA